MTHASDGRARATYGSETVLVDVADAVALVTLNRPHARNAIDPKLNLELAQALLALEADESVRAIVVTGAGAAFCAGADLSAGGAAFDATQLDAFGFGSDAPVGLPSLRPWRWRTPVVAAINGMAIGGGLTLSLAFDVRFAAEDARLRFVFPRLGVTPEGAASWLLPRLVGASRAAELLLSGRWFTGAEAAEMGLVSAAFPADRLLDEAMAFAADLAANTAPHAVAATKRLLHRHLGSGDREEAFAVEEALVLWAGAQPDTVEGVTALLEKRPPRWTGSKHLALPDPIDDEERM